MSKIVFTTLEKSFKSTVILFRLTNSPVIFQIKFYRTWSILEK